MNESINWEEVRRDFPVAEQLAYLNSAAAGPVPRCVALAAREFYQEMMMEGDAAWDEWLRRRELIRARVAEFINADPDEIAFTINTSSGMNLIVDALEKRGEVISCDLEFPVTTLPWLHRGVPVRMLENQDGEIAAEQVRQEMKAGAGIICLSHVQYSNGFRCDLEELGRNKEGCLLVVNASQSAGALQIDVKRMRIDALCATGHKWMLSGYGSGFVYLSRELLRETRARAVSWLSVEEPFTMDNRRFKPRADAAARAEMGCPHFAGIFALGASVEYMLGLGQQNIERRVLDLNRRLTARLMETGWQTLSPVRDEGSRSGETLVAAARPKRTVARLAQHGVAVTEKPQGFRVATHFFNDEADIERLIAALEDARGL
ncbi:MAG: cysteine desulfurase / selenocysteine lyase [Blastocatellia bacterium]|jgi:selenocysteine lyase/cysteine desulfurase|nr:cysteine desulfurase / selenocysteine lyase [Blastocatellia bacterium]